MNVSDNNEMKTEQDFINRVEQTGKQAVVTPADKLAENAKAERERMQQVIAIKSKKEHTTKKQEKAQESKVEIEDLQATQIAAEPVDGASVEASNINKIETPIEPTVDTNAPWEPEHISEIKEESVSKKPSKTKSEKKSVKEISVISSSEAAAIEVQNEEKSKLGKEIIEDNMDQRVRDENLEIRKINDSRFNEEDDDALTPEKVIETFNNNYEDSEDVETTTEKTVELVSDKSDKPEVKKAVETAIDAASEEREHNYYGGDGKQTSFKIRTAKVAKVLRNIKLADTDSVSATDISKKTQKEQQNIYMTTVMPTLQPSYSVVPFVVSGVVITMTAFNWTDIAEICKIDEKLDNLDPSSSDYIYEKNLIFLEKREKQLDIFYRHIYSVSGFEEKPSRSKLYGEIIKFPDFQQLFFAAYAATFQKPTAIGLTCATCGTTHELMVGSKDLCFLLNKHIEIDKLNRYIDKGAISGSSTAEIYAEFQKEKIVESANKIFRIKEKLPNSSFIYELQVPYVEQAYSALSEIVEKFRDKPLEYVDEETESMVSIDSSFGLPDYLIELRKYLYIKTLLVPQIISEDSNSAKVSYVRFEDLDGIIDSVYQLSPEDYNSLMDDSRLNSLMRISGIRHLIDGKQCPEESCKAELGLLPVEPETLFFMIARRK